MQTIPDIPSLDVERLVRRDYPSGSMEDIHDILNLYGAEEWERETDRVRLAALKLADGDIDKLRLEIETAKHDYRDVLAVAEYPAYSRETRGASRLTARQKQKLIDADWTQYREWLKR